MRHLNDNFPSRLPPHYVSTVVSRMLPPKPWTHLPTDKLLLLAKRRRELMDSVSADPVRYFRPSVGGQWDFMSLNDNQIQGLYFFAGNKSGKTTGAAILVSENASGEPLWGAKAHGGTRVPTDLLLRGRAPLRIAAFCEDFNTHEETIVPTLLSWTPKRVLAPNPVLRGPSGNVIGIRYANGSHIYFRTYDQGYAKAEGKDYDLVWCDEPPDRSIYTAIWRGLVATRGRLVIAATLLSEAWLYDELEQPFVRVFDGTMHDNPWLDNQARENYIALLTEDERRIRIEGKASSLTGRIYPSFVDRPPFVIDTEPRIWDVNTEEPYPVILGVDPHERKGMYCIWGWLTPEDKIVWFDWTVIPNDRVSVMFAKLAEIESRHTSPARLVVLDPNRGQAIQIDNRSWESEFNDHEYETILGVDDINFGHSQLREMLAQNSPLMVWMDTCRGPGGPVFQMSHYTWDEHPRKSAYDKDLKERPKAKYKDFPDIHRYVACAHLEFSVFASGRGYETLSLPEAKAHAGRNPYLRI